MSHHAHNIVAVNDDTFITWNMASTYSVYQIQGAVITPIDTFEYHPTFTMAQAQVIAQSWFNDSFGQ